MRPLLPPMLLAAALASTACSAADGALPPGETSQSIVNGEADPGHPGAVAVLFIWPKPNGKLGAVSCTGAIYDATPGACRVLTAAHCLLENPGEGKPQPVPNQMHVLEGADFGCFLTDQTGASCPAPVHPVLAIDADPGFAHGASPPLADHDLGVVTIDGCGPTTPTLPLLLNDTMAPGMPVEIVGYGETDYSNPPLTNTGRRHVVNTLVAAYDTPTTVGIEFDSSGGPGGTCDGDSGGPWLVDVGGVQQVGAVTSVGHHCNSSTIAARVSSAFGGFLAPYMPAGSGGSGGSGAAGGTGGVAGTGGAGTGGSAGSGVAGTAPGTGGASAGTGAAVGDADSSGSCSTGPSRGRWHVGLSTLAVALLVVLRRRRAGIS